MAVREYCWTSRGWQDAQGWASRLLAEKFITANIKPAAGPHAVALNVRGVPQRPERTRMHSRV